MLVMIFSLSITCLAAGAEDEARKPAAPTMAPKAAAREPVAMRPARANFAVISGAITKIDNSDPANIKLDVKNDADGIMHTIQLTPWTNITKVTDASELKTGEAVRVMSRKVDDKEVAMGVMFGKIRMIPPPPPARQAAAPVTAPVAQEGVKK
jgi:hypothetical protein